MQFHPTTALEEHLDAIENEPIALYNAHKVYSY